MHVALKDKTPYKQLTLKRHHSDAKLGALMTFSITSTRAVIVQSLHSEACINLYVTAWSIFTTVLKMYQG